MVRLPHPSVNVFQDLMVLFRLEFRIGGGVRACGVAVIILCAARPLLHVPYVTTGGADVPTPVLFVFGTVSY